MAMRLHHYDLGQLKMNILYKKEARNLKARKLQVNTHETKGDKSGILVCVCFQTDKVDESDSSFVSRMRMRRRERPEEEI